VTDKATSDLWWKNAVMYCVDVATFMDSDGDGIGDLAGLTRQLDYLASLGVNCLWLLPIYPSPMRDDGYDITDYYSVDPRFGTLGDFVELVRSADNLGMRVILDLVLNHTSNEHPWFDEARRDKNSVYRDYYVWSDEKQDEPSQVVFPGEQESTWTYDDVAGQWYLHRYYDFMPDLNIANVRVRDEMDKIIGFWLQQGIAGFRVDSAPFLIETVGLDDAADDPHVYLQNMRGFLGRRSGSAILLGEANIDPEDAVAYFGGDDCTELQMLFDFSACACAWLALGRENASALGGWLRNRPDAPSIGQYSVFLRHHDELNLERLSEDDRDEVFAMFAPSPEQRIYGRGLRPRTASLLGGDGPRLRMAMSLLQSMPGSPMMLYGDEIGLGDDLDLDGRLAVRVPMQWTHRDNAGFSTAPKDELLRPVRTEGPFGCEHVNVADQLRDPTSLLSWTKAAIHTRRQCPELGWGDIEVLDAGDDRVLVVLATWLDGRVVTLHNFCDEPCTVDLRPSAAGGEVLDLFGSDDEKRIETLDEPIELEPYGVRWVRLVEGRSGAPGT
jgi:maltose alpha-D-glucosyltransferase/alpha-amylase